MYPYNIQVVDRVLDIMDFIAVAKDECGLAEITQALKLPKSTVHRLLMVMERHQLVERNPRSERYRLGLKLFELQSRAISKRDISQLGRPFLEQLVAETGETAHLGILREGEVISLSNVQSPHTLRPSTVGRRIPAYCTSLGKAMLAGLPDHEFEAYLASHRFAPRTPNTICNSSRLKAEIRRIRKRGYAVDNEEFERGLKCVGAPVRDHTGKVIAALSVAGPISRVGREHAKTIRQAVIKAAFALSRALGYSGEDQSS